MFHKKKYLGVAIFLANITYCLCFVNYEMFTGFDLTNEVVSTENTTAKMETNVTKMETTPAHKTKTKKLIKTTQQVTEPTMPTLEPAKLKDFKMTCPENEQPINFGTYEIPTQRDLVLFTKRTLLKMFNSYHEKTLILLKDIKEATQASEQYDKNCRGRNKIRYKNCVKRVSKECVSVVKGLVAMLEEQKQSVNAVIEETTCNMKEMKTDPIELVKMLARDEAALEFALPAFLRLIGGCANHCSKQANSIEYILRRRPSRHMTDQDLVIKHFLTKKTYIQLIKESETNAPGSKNAGLVNWMHSAHS